LHNSGERTLVRPRRPARWCYRGSNLNPLIVGLICLTLLVAVRNCPLTWALVVRSGFVAAARFLTLPVESRSVSRSEAPSCWVVRQTRVDGYWLAANSQSPDALVLAWCERHTPSISAPAPNRMKAARTHGGLSVSPAMMTSSHPTGRTIADPYGWDVHRHALNVNQIPMAMATGSQTQVLLRSWSITSHSSGRDMHRTPARRP
jgi:hypothetical protein